MKCCIGCFKDIHIRSIIEKLGDIGDCDYCSNKKVAVYDISIIPNEITDAIVSLVQIYTLSDLPEAKPLKAALHDDWDIFSTDEAMIQKLVIDICGSVISPYSDIFSENVIISQLFDDDFRKEFGVVRGSRWEHFAKSIKYENRFHNGMFNADAFTSFLSIIAKSYSAGTEFYRARIADNSGGYNKTQMSVPPTGKRSAGRINPEGIATLYLSSEKETALNEVRASTFDYVSIGRFKLLENIKVVNLSKISRMSPFLYNGGLEQYAINRNVFKEIADEVAKPLRRSDSPLEYLPTQYVAEFIKSQSYDGVEYASTFRENSYNIAIFNEKLFECVDVRTIEVTKVQYETR